MSEGSPEFFLSSKEAYPVGDITVATGEDGLVAILFDPKGLEVLRRLSDAPVLDVGHDAEDPKSSSEAKAHVMAAHRQLREYFAGNRTDFDLSLDLDTLQRIGAPGSTGFQQEVQLAMVNIPYGQTLSYGEIAANIGNPGAARAVGSACANNPFPIVVPCHRVVRSDGSRGHYTGGSGIKDFLLNLEQETSILSPSNV